MKQLSSHWTDIHEILCLSISQKSVGVIQILLKSDKNKGYFTWKSMYIRSYFAQFFLEGNIIQTKSRENQNTYFMFSKFHFFFETPEVYGVMWKNIVERGRPQMTIWRMRIACWITKSTNAHTKVVINTHSFSTATMVLRRHLNVTVYVLCLSCSTLACSLKFSKFTVLENC
jgi:hypothetical protein